MFSSLKNMMGGDRSSQSGPSSNPAKIKADQPVGLQALLGDDPPRLDGSDRFFGMENVVGLRPDQPNGNTCYANSILQCLYYSKPFRESVVNFPFRAQPPYQPKESNANGSQTSPVPDRGQLVRVNTELLPTMSAAAYAAMRQRSAVSPGGAVDSKKKPLPGAGSVASPTNNAMENKDSPEYKKKKALENGPILEIDQLNNSAYGMSENLFSALKDIFESIMATGSRTGIIKPNKFLEILRRENEMFSGQTHQDAHEFLNYVLNEVIENVDSFQKRMKNENINITLPIKAATAESLTPINASSTASTSSLSTSTAVTGWIHDLFEGLLTSETKCLTCENVSRRDEQFLDLSIDLEKNSSVTSCLRNFSASEMLCERNKFHCDTCGGLQEAEKRMKVKKLPKVLALHLKRFKYMEQTSKFEKLHHRVLYPYHLRLFNTTDDADDPDRLYELYAVVVHIGGGPFHGHYVAIIKTEDKGWLLFDDELVEPVSREYVMNFFGERSGNGVASAYILFYQETTLEAVQSEQWSDFLPTSGATHDVSKSEQIKTRAPVNGATNGINGHVSPPALNPDSVDLAPRPLTSPEAVRVTPPVPVAAENPMPMVKSKKEREREKKEEKEREKAQRKAEKEKREAKEKENGVSVSNGGEGSGMSRFRTTSKSMRKKPQWFGSKEKDKAADVENEDDLHPLPPTPGFGPLDGGKPANKKSLNLERKPAPVSENGKENGKETPKDTEESEKDLEKDQERASDTDSGKEHGKEHGIGSRFRRKHKDGKKEQKEHKKDKSDDIVPKKHHSHRPSLLNLNGLRKKSAAIGARD